MITLPIIDISPYLPGSNASHEAKVAISAQLHQACIDYGFFYLDISNFVSATEPKDLIEQAREFFKLPQDQKDQISISKQDHARGYQRLKENVTNGLADNHEAIDFYRPVEHPDKSKTLWGENQWPRELPAFEPAYQQWITKMKQLGLIVMEAMAAGLGLAQDEWEGLRDQVDDPFWVLRVIGYPPLPPGSEGFSCGAHKDYGCLTFLYADPTPSALQVYSKHPGAPDGEWINADPIPGCIVCNIGEMWEIWTAGLYKSTLHQVVHRASNYRVSIPFFYEPNFDANITALPAARRLLGDQIENNKSDESVVYGKFLLQKVGNNFDGGGGKYAAIKT